MSRAVERWFEQESLWPKWEVKLPWGICDLVGLGYNVESCLSRVESGGEKPLGSIANVCVYRALPTARSRTALSPSGVKIACRNRIEESDVDLAIADLISRGHVRRNARGNLSRNGNWFPFHTRIVAVEMKLTRLKDVLSQALNHKAITQETYIALPIRTASQFSEKTSIDSQFPSVGVLGIDDETCRVILAPQSSNRYRVDPVIEAATAEKFWAGILDAVNH